MVNYYVNYPAECSSAYTSLHTSLHKDACKTAHWHQSLGPMERLQDGVGRLCLHCNSLHTHSVVSVNCMINFLSTHTYQHSYCACWSLISATHRCHVPSLLGYSWRKIFTTHPLMRFQPLHDQTGLLSGLSDAETLGCLRLWNEGDIICT